MSSNLSDAKRILDLIGGDDVITRLKAKGVEGTNKGLRFLVPILGGLVEVRISKALKCWDISLEFDMLSTAPRLIKDVPDEKLSSMVRYLFSL